jgi:hypothetical protein
MMVLDYLRWALNACELLAVITGFIFWSKLKYSYWKWFPIYLLLILATELIALYLSEVTKDGVVIAKLYRYWVLPLEFFFFYWLVSQEAKNFSEKKWPLLGSIIYFICWLSDIFYFHSIKLWFTSFSYTAGNIILVVLILNFFFKFINSKAIINYKSSMMFWVLFGALIFYLGTLPFYGLRNTLYYQYKDIFSTYNYIQLILDCAMYLLFTLAIIWGKVN